MTRLPFARGALVLVTVAAAATLHVPTAAEQSAPAAPARTTGRALTIEDYYRVPTVGAPQISPDGRWVSFTMSTRVEENQGTRSEAWVVSSDGSQPARKIAHDGKDATGASWTPESRLRYTVDGQAWTIDPGAPGAPPTRVEGGGGGPAGAAGRGGGGGGRGGGGAGRGGGGGGTPSPDGAWTAIVRDKAPARGPAATPTSSDFERRHDERFKGVQFDWMDFQRDGGPFPAPNLAARPAQQIVLQAAGGGEPKVLVDQEMRPTGVAWHPKGTLIAFLGDSTWRDELKYDNTELYTITIDGALTKLTNDGYLYSDLEFSPDGTYLSYARTFGTDMIIDQRLNHGGSRDLFLRPVAGGDPINLTAKWDLEPGDTRWSPDGRFLYFSAAVGGENHFFRVSVPDGRIEQLTKGERRVSAISIDRAFKTIAYSVAVHDSPPDIYVAGIDGTNERRLTDLHRALRTEIAFGKTDRLKWPSYDGTPIEGWLTYPYGYEPARRYPLIVFSHGGPHSATGYSFDFKKQFFAANGYFVLDTNFRSSTGYGDAFKWATWGEWGKKDGEDVMSGIDYAIKRYPIDPKRVGHTGHSYGGFMTNWLITQYPDRLAAAIAGAGISNWISDYGTADIYRTKETEFFGTPWDKDARERMIKQSPLTYAGNVRTPTLFVHGEVDQRVPYTEAEQMYFALKRRGIPAKMIQYAGQPHGIGGHWNNVHRMLNELRWWEMYLKGR